MNAGKKSFNWCARPYFECWHIHGTLQSLMSVGAFGFIKGPSHPDLMSWHPVKQECNHFYRWAKWNTEKLRAHLWKRTRLLLDSFTNIMTADSFHSTLLLAVLLHRQGQSWFSSGLDFICPSTHPTRPTFIWYHHVPGPMLGSRDRETVGRWMQN